eukprot:3896242-Pleurochrysis_carterae.AAC.1
MRVRLSGVAWGAPDADACVGVCGGLSCLVVRRCSWDPIAHNHDHLGRSLLGARVTFLSPHCTPVPSLSSPPFRMLRQ